ncbi:Sulfotransferase family protein [Gracilibacillus orientalis]|uniref:Sulfotransferase family protein n=1 Tax=Gracilibacillus orientalis TaxID=334253 RepID=A0A1I4N0D3_9BACI|nr:sulfotransferase family 2 domain-containing protein [Gracilibacillus orientalis]SFM08777.1 Sulfotransferase family protein [Gracilibacillus orientalis]
MIIFDKEATTPENPVFLHIPKTGGKTLWDLFERQQDTIHVWHNRYFKEYQKPIRFFTILRDPADRVISTYYYIRSYERDALYQKVNNMPLQEFIEYMQNDKIENKLYKKKDIRNIRYRTVNLATRYLSGGDPNDLEQAKKNITKHFDLVGFTDMYLESLFFMNKIHDWNFSSINRKNKTDNRPKIDEISPKIIQSIEQVNQHDKELYEWAKRKFHKKLTSLDKHTKKELNKWVNQF